MEPGDHQEQSSVALSDGRRREWSVIGRTSGYVAAAAFLIGTTLYLLDATDLISTTPQFHATSAGRLQDEAKFWIAIFAHRRDILWDIWARDLILPVAFGALIVVSVALRRLAGRDRPDAELMTLFIMIGGVISALADLLFLGSTEYWRQSGWAGTPSSLMVAVGRDTQAIDSLDRWPEAVGFVVLAVGVVYLGRLCRREAALPDRLGLLAYLEAVLLVGIAVAGVTHSDTAYNVFSLATGAFVGPVLAIWLASVLGRLASVSSRST